MEGVDNYIDSIPDLESTDMPAGIFTDPNIGGSSPIISSSLFSSLALNDVSKLQHLSTPTSQTQTWKRLLFGKKKRVSTGTGAHVELLKKNKSVF